MSENLDWKAQFIEEIHHAEQARAAGNEGRARVCARRAAGIVLGEYYRRQNIPDPGASTYSRLVYFDTLLDASPRAREAVQHLLIRVTPDFKLPIQVDLIHDAQMLMKVLLEE